MKSYRIPTPRAAIGAAAVALTALTIGLCAVLPAETGPSERMLDIASSAPGPNMLAAPTDLRYIEPIEVVGVRARVISAREHDTRAKRGDEG